MEASIATTLLSAERAHRTAADGARCNLVPQAPLPALPLLNAIGTPEQLLRRRPDVRVAERRLAAATARIGVAVGDLFPKVTLVGEVGYFAPTFGEFGQSEARFFSVGPEYLLGGFRSRPGARKNQLRQGIKPMRRSPPTKARCSARSRTPKGR